MNDESATSPCAPYVYGVQGAGQHQRRRRQPSVQPRRQQLQQLRTSNQLGLASINHTSFQAQQASSMHAILPSLRTQNDDFNRFGSLPDHPPQTPTINHLPAYVPITGDAGATAVAPLHTSSGYNLPSSYICNYPMSQSMHPSFIGSPIPVTSSSVGFPTSRVTPQGGIDSSVAGLPSLIDSIQMLTMSMLNEGASSRFIDSQGRCVNLPSVLGWPGAVPQGTCQFARDKVPQKDADGEFSCPKCAKTYVHLKHLKRHLLRHTGERPHECHRCKYKFFRSDVLKRHLSKCSIRRGNPTGIDRLAHRHIPKNNNARRLPSIDQQDEPIRRTSLPDIAGVSVYSGAIVGHSETITEFHPSHSSWSEHSDLAWPDAPLEQCDWSENI